MHEQTRGSLAHVALTRARRRRGPAGRETGPAALPTPADVLRPTLRQRLIAFYLMPSEADHWIDIWTSSVATGDPCSAEYWDRGFRWIVTAVAGHGPERPAPCASVDPALAAVISRGFHS